MSRLIMIGLFVMVTVLITACGSGAVQVDEIDAAAESAAEVAVENTGDTATDEESESQVEKTREELRADFADNALPPASQLLLGTFLLEDSEFAVDADLAPYLVPYWKLYKSLLESDTTASEELDALIAEIQDVMDVDQINYIAGLELTQEDLTTYMNESGIMENMRLKGAEDGDGTGTRPGQPDDIPAGTGPGGGQGGGDGVMDPELQATMQAEREARGTAGGMGASRMMVPLIDALVELLEGKAGS
jgi:hypothetical protein